MLVIRLSRTGRKNQPAYRMVVTEHTAPIQGKFLEVVGFYNPSDGKKFEFNEERIRHWISVGAKPSDTVASLLKTNGVSGMDDFLSLRDKKRAKKNPEEEPEVKAAPVEEAAPVVKAAPVEEAAPVVKAAPVEEATSVAE